MDLLDLLSLTGVAFFAVSGALAAGRKSLDLFGVLVIAAVAAVGGGTIRDLLLDRAVFWIREPANLVVILFSALLTVVYARRFTPPNKLLFVADGLGLALFSIMGAQIAQSEGLAAIVVVLMAIITGVAGGILRDVLSAEVPLILRRGHLYATAAAAGTGLYLVLEALGTPHALAGLAGVVAVAALRFGSIFWDLELPVFSLSEDQGSG